jgi:Flp pilus assembly protein TadD
MPGFVEDQRAAAAHLVEQGDLDGALERLALAEAVAPDDPEVRRALALARSRRALRPA